eukprot:6207092-Pleurochrysis_carterae.AAC.1
MEQHRKWAWRSPRNQPMKKLKRACESAALSQGQAVVDARPRAWVVSVRKRPSAAARRQGARPRASGTRPRASALEAHTQRNALVCAWACRYARLRVRAYSPSLVLGSAKTFHAHVAACLEQHDHKTPQGGRHETRRARASAASCRSSMMPMSNCAEASVSPACTRAPPQWQQDMAHAHALKGAGLFGDPV